MSAETQDPLFQAAFDAFVYCMPLVDVAALNARAAANGRGANAFRHARALSNARTQQVTAPNNDTLSSSAFIDLAGGPVQIELPATGARYFSLQLMDAYTNTFAVLGTRTTGPHGGVFTLVGPEHAAPPRAIRAPTPLVWALGRMLIDGPDDLPAAHELQDRLKLRSTAAPRPARPAASSKAADWRTFFLSAQEHLRLNPPPATDQAVLERLAILGLSPRGGFDPSRFDDKAAARIAAGVEAARKSLQTPDATFRLVGDWAYQSAQIGNYGQDYALRASTAQWGIAALPPQETLYARGAGEDGSYFYPGGASYSLRFAPGQTPPVGAFWSLTLYEAAADGSVRYFDNPADRYSLGDRSGLRPSPDGGLDIWISPNDPGGARTANWLPAPAAERFVLLLRAYLPSRAMVDGTYVLPPIQRH